MLKFFRTFDLPVSLLTLLAVPAFAHMPYSPTRIFLSPVHEGELLYIFQPTSSSPSSFQLLSLNTTSTLHTSNLPYKILSTSLPFLGSGTGLAFTPVINEWGGISIYAGRCADNSGGAQLWRFTPDDKTLNGDGAWARKTFSASGVDGHGDLIGANYLSSGISFSSTVGGRRDSAGVYIFGGMCPTATAPSGDWTASANYSNSMLRLTPSSTSSASVEYNLGMTSSRGPPIAEAGFSITSLEPSFTNSSSGDENRQQNFVLLGGHTQQAFINMSQVAIFSLPEETWSFQPVNSASPNARTDLTARDRTNVDPRSGHTTVLSPDGKKLVIFGGWVGDVTMPADPQLVVLQLGEGYGGTDEWAWTIPTQTGTGLAKGAGIYGHGAVMLPGGVMMATGGYAIPASTKSKTKRADPSLNTQNYFFNVTSSSWISSYTKPLTTLVSSSSSDLGSDYLTPSKRAGLGAGLALGFAVIIGAAIVWFWYSRRLKHRREAREKELRELALGAQRFHSSALGLGGIDGRGGEKSAMDWMGEQQRSSRKGHPWATSGTSRNGGFGEGPGWRNNGSTEAERTGLLVEVPSPTRGLRRSLHSRGAYQQAPRLDDARRSLAFSNIHPIEERDEHEGDIVEPVSAELEGPRGMGTINVVATAPQLDPFRDPAPLGSHPIVSRTPSPVSAARERALEVQNWVSDWTAADALLHSTGRTSPDKADRTSSTLSELSMRSDLSAHSIQRSAGTISRSISQRSGAFFSTNPFSSNNTTTNSSPTFDRPGSAAGGRRSPQSFYNRPNYGRSRSLTLVPQHRHNNSDTSNPATATFPQLRTEGEALLGGRPEWAFTPPESPTKTRSRATGWMGSMRRALTGTGGDRSHSTSPESGARSASSSPTKHGYQDGGGDTDLPRRAASAGAMLWRRRQGARDWDVEDRIGSALDSGGKLKRRGEEGSAGGNGDGGDDEEEWDVEAAVERRVVQVMFTVPREKLRVVNGEVDCLSVSDVGEAVVGKRQEGENRAEEGEKIDKGKGKEVERD
ncbi:MAG: hypothetical protein M1830_009491 [Pleopsidium flavum]|nr:MAG: hypothetical protein M1830_009491 [Pleopsidium flavum]